MSNTTTEINWHNTLPQNLEGHKCIAVTKTGETIEGILEYRTAQPDMYVKIDSLHFPGVKPWLLSTNANPATKWAKNSSP